MKSIWKCAPEMVVVRWLFALVVLLAVMGCVETTTQAEAPEAKRDVYYKVTSGGESWYAAGDVRTPSFMDNPWMYAIFDTPDGRRVEVWSARGIVIEQVWRDEALYRGNADDADLMDLRG